MVKCQSCESTNVEEKRWVHANTFEVSDPIDDHSNTGYCIDCGEIVELIYDKVVIKKLFEKRKLNG